MAISSYVTLLDPIRARAATAPDWPGIVLMHEDGAREVLTAADLWSDVLTVANGLRNAGLRPDDVVILIMDHSRQQIVTFLAAMAAGLVPTIVSGVNPRLDLEIYRGRIDKLVRSSGAAAIVTRATDAIPLGNVLADLPCPVVESELLTGAADPNVVASAASAEPVAFIQYSSGSGGVQKGAVHTHGALLRYIESKRVGHPLSKEDVVVCWTPLYHDLGLLSGLLAPQVIGFRAVLMSPLHWARQPGLLLRAMHEYRGTICYMPNFALNHCVRAVRESDVRDLDLREWKLLLLGGEPVRAGSLRAFAERFAAQGFRESSFRAGYGMAEMVEGVTSGKTGPPNVDWIRVAALQRDGYAEPVSPTEVGATSFVSCGPPKDGAEVRIVDANGDPLAERHVGEIEVRCEFRMREYHRRPDLTQAAFRDGWFRSRDLGYLVDGELYVVGRTSDLIIVGGRKVAAEDIEAIAEQVPGVLAGRSVAFGIADERAGTERVVLVCESRQPNDAEQQIAIERQLRRDLTQALEVTLGEMHLVERGWIIKTSSGKKARGANRDKYRDQLAPPGDPAPR